MSKISVSEINKLRQFTGLGLLDCKNALVESEGDFDKAVTMLRKKGLKIAAGKQDREASEGISFAKIADNKKIGVIVELSCETDFVAKNETFINLADTIASLALKNNITDIDTLLNTQVDDGLKVSDYITETSVKVGEKIVVKNYVILTGDAVVQYIHSNYRIAVLISLEGSNITNEAIDATREVAMQIASMNPIALNREDVDKDTINKELEIAKEQALKEGKQGAYIDKIAEGKLNKFFKENVLLEQAFVKDTSRTVKQYLDNFSGIKIVRYIRSQIK